MLSRQRDCSNKKYDDDDTSIVTSTSKITIKYEMISVQMSENEFDDIPIVK